VGSAVTLLWIELADGEREVLEQAVRDAGATMRRADREGLAAQTFAALALGGVVVVARTGREASTALGLGADEVVRLGEISRKAVGGAMDRARARAATRLVREMRPPSWDAAETWSPPALRGPASSGSPASDPVGRLVAHTVEGLRLGLPAGIKLTLELHGACAARTASPQVAPALTALVHQAAEALGEVSGPRAAIQVRLAEHEDTVVLEVQHAAGGAPGDLRPSLVETFLASSATPRTRLVDLRERVRRCGGDLVVDGDHTSTTVRVFFPALASELFHEGPADHALPRTR
jgi:hypothetical protein